MNLKISRGCIPTRYEPKKGLQLTTTEGLQLTIDILNSFVKVIHLRFIKNT